MSPTLQQLLDDIDRRAWGRSTRRACPLCGRYAVEGHTPRFVLSDDAAYDQAGDLMRQWLEQPDACPLGQLRELAETAARIEREADAALVADIEATVAEQRRRLSAIHTNLTF